MTQLFILFFFFFFSVPAGASTVQPVRDKFPSAALIIQDETFNLWLEVRVHTQTRTHAHTRTHDSFSSFALV